MLLSRFNVVFDGGGVYGRKGENLFGDGARVPCGSNWLVSRVCWMHGRINLISCGKRRERFGER